MHQSPTELCNLALKYNTDKCPQIKHTYTPFYYHLFKERRNNINKVLEIGIGPYRARPKSLGPKGGSLYMWEEFFPTAQIFGADINPQLLINSPRIRSFLCNQTKAEDLTQLIENTGADLDLVIDDASHELPDQIKTCQMLMPLLKKDVVYIIEDASYSKKIVAALSDYCATVPDIAKRNASNQLVMVTNN